MQGEWISLWYGKGEDGYPRHKKRDSILETSDSAICSLCGKMSERPLGNYCKWCGAPMTEKEEVLA